MGRFFPKHGWPSRLALLVVCAVLLAACGTVIGFPDRSLDESDANVPEAGALPDTMTADSPVDTSVPVDAGPAHVSLSTSEIDFGLVACGAAAPTAKVLTITNSGGAPLTWNATLAPTPDFSITSASAGTVAPGAFATLTVAATAVSALSAAKDTAQGVLTLKTNDTESATVAVPIKRTAAGGTLSVVPLTASFGDTPVSVAAQNVNVALMNTGNQPVTVGFGAILPAGGGFSLAWTLAPAAVTIPPGGTMPALVAGFKPTSKASFAGTSAINVTGALCGTNPTELTFTGNGTDSAALVQPGSLDFGLVDCGTQALPKKIKILNSSATDFTWSAALTANVNFTLSPASGTAPANSFSEVTVTPVAIPSTSPVAPNYYGDTLTILTAAPGDYPHTVDLLMTAHGAILAQSTGAVDFGSVLVSAPATSTFTVSNSGNAPATVSYVTTPAVFSVSPQAQVVGSGSNYIATARFAPTAEQAYAGTATMTVEAGTVLCQPLKSPITLTGQGALGAQVAPSSLDFGLVACGSTGTAKTVTLTNASPSTFAWTASVATAYYTIAPASGSLASGASAMITVTPNMIPTASATTADLYADSLTVTVPALAQSFVSSLHMTAQGAILSFNPTPTLSFGGVQTGNSKQKTFVVVNDGNLAASIGLTRTGSQFSMSPNPTNTTVNATSSTVPITVSFNPTSNGPQNGAVTMTSSTKLCAPLPAALKLTGDGT